MKISSSSKTRSLFQWVALFTGLSWLGEVIHNRIELPGITLLGPENNLTALTELIIYALWLLFPSTITKYLLFTLALVHLVGGAVLSVIPFPFLPFYPEQTIDHYLAHLLYGLAQLPLMAIMFFESKRAREN
jgi:hypothetical protein